MKLTGVLLFTVMSATNSFVPGSSGKAAGSNVPIAHLDYSYVKDCTKAEELEEIITVLRSVVKALFLLQHPSCFRLANSEFRQR
jgi:hypothetical protein